MYSRTDAVDEDREDECEEDALSFASASSASDDADARAEGMVSLLSTDRSSRRNSAGTAGDDIPGRDGSSSADHRGDAARGGARQLEKKK